MLLLGGPSCAAVSTTQSPTTVSTTQSPATVSPTANRTSPSAWKAFITNGGAEVDLYGVGGPADSGGCPSPPPSTPLKPVFHLLLSNQSFAEGVAAVASQGVTFDLVIDEGGRPYASQKRTFEALWPLVNRGGVYFVEGLERSNSDDGLVRDVLGWADFLLRGAGDQWTDWRTKVPEELLSVHCQGGVCGFRKAYKEGKKRGR